LNQRHADEHISATDLGSSFAGLFYKQAKPGCCFFVACFDLEFTISLDDSVLL
jgi:hypothetical protein